MSQAAIMNIMATILMSRSFDYFLSALDHQNLKTRSLLFLEFLDFFFCFGLFLSVSSFLKEIALLPVIF